MIRIKKEKSLEKLDKLKAMYIEQATAPLDGMWLCGFVPMANHFGIYEEENLFGYFCINEDGYLLQYMLDKSYRTHSEEIFKSLLDMKNPEVDNIKGAFCSTAEPGFMSLCLDIFRTNKVNALMYQYDKSLASIEERLELTLLEETNLNDAVTFAHEAIGAPTEWLQSYFSNLINRQELFAVIQDGTIIATGECRGYDEYQTDYADIGVIVSPNERSKGIATKVINSLTDIAVNRNLRPICSTEASNIGAQKAITRSGFYANNRIIKFDYNVQNI